MNKERLIAFTDAVLAIIMTILVLELAKPAHPTLASFWALRKNYFAYALSFFWLGSLWIALNGIWEKVKNISTPVIFWNLVLLFLASFMPYSTGLVSTYFYSKVVQGFYGLIIVLITIANVILHKVIDKPNKDVPELLAISKAYRRMLFPDILIKIAGFVLAVTVYPPCMMYAVLISAAYALTRHFTTLA